jgi:hypothetical protein
MTNTTKKPETQEELNEEYRQSMKRCFQGRDLGATYARMDGPTMRTNTYLTNAWNYAIDQEWIRVETVELEQETFLKGFITPKGIEEVFND